MLPTPAPMWCTPTTRAPPLLAQLVVYQPAEGGLHVCYIVGLFRCDPARNHRQVTASRLPCQLMRQSLFVSRSLNYDGGEPTN